ncbi:MAG: replicative DNA helicase [bacterium]|nr:replicative DNA helicase [bacterium]
MAEERAQFKNSPLVSENISFRMPPHNKDAEMSVLGSLMLDRNAPMKVMDVLSHDDFYYENHRVIYKTIIELFEKHEPVDVLSVSSRLKEKGHLEQIGGMSYIAHLVNTVPSTVGITHYADIVNKKRVLRDLIEASQHINHLGYQEDADVEESLDEAEHRILSISQASLRKKFIPVKSALAEAFERIDRLHKKKDEVRGIATGFFDVDKILSGLQNADLIVLACRPSLGKTSLALDIARNVALQKNVPVGIFSLEMSTEQLIDRFLAAEARIDLWKLRNGRLAEDEFPRLRDALSRLSQAPIFIDDEATTNILQIRTKARRLQAEHGLGLIIVDYLQLMQPRTATDSMVMQITEISRSLKTLAKELNVPVLALSQLSRSVEQRHPPIPRLSDLRDSGSIEQDADVVMFIYREDKYKSSSDKQNQADILVEKHRNGPTGRATLFFNKEFASFSSLDRKHSDDQIQW